MHVYCKDVATCAALMVNDGDPFLQSRSAANEGGHKFGVRRCIAALAGAVAAFPSSAMSTAERPHVSRLQHAPVIQSGFAANESGDASPHSIPPRPPFIVRLPPADESTTQALPPKSVVIEMFS